MFFLQSPNEPITIIPFYKMQWGRDRVALLAFLKYINIPLHSALIGFSHSQEKGKIFFHLGTTIIKTPSVFLLYLRTSSRLHLPLSNFNCKSQLWRSGAYLKYIIFTVLLFVCYSCCLQSMRAHHQISGVTLSEFKQTM